MRQATGRGVRRLQGAMAVDFLSTVRVALFIPCFIDQFYPEVGKAMVAVLRRVGGEPGSPRPRRLPVDIACPGIFSRTSSNDII